VDGHGDGVGTTWCVAVDGRRAALWTELLISDRTRSDLHERCTRGVCDRKLSVDFATVRVVEQLSLQLSGGAPVVEIIRSARRKRTISAHRVGERIEVHVPARMSQQEEAQWVERMVRRVLSAERRRRRSDEELLARALELSACHLDGRARPAGVRWVDNQQQRWGSCTPADGTIRLSHRLQGMPAYVVDYVLLHELAHLLEPGHGARFQALMARCPQLERAEGFLEGVSAAAGLPAA
jgi:predicted metal-dependent hydrolase